MALLLKCFNFIMDIKQLEIFVKEKGAAIVSVLMENNNPDDFEQNHEIIEKEIYDVASSYATILFFEKQILFSEEVKKEIALHVYSKFNLSGQKIDEMKESELLSNWIKSEVIKNLEKRNIYLF
jgi:glutamyl/glutaminyl-tRNA synthetase